MPACTTLGSSQAITPGITHWSPLVMLILNCQSRCCQFLHYMRVIVFFSLKTSMQSIGRLQWCKSLLFMDVVSIDDSCPIHMVNTTVAANQCFSSFSVTSMFTSWPLAFYCNSRIYLCCKQYTFTIVSNKMYLFVCLVKFCFSKTLLILFFTVLSYFGD